MFITVLLKQENRGVIMNEKLNKSTSAPSKIDTSKESAVSKSVRTSEQFNDIEPGTTAGISTNRSSIEKTWQMSYSTGHIDNELVKTRKIGFAVLPKPAFQGEISIGDIHLFCYVLNNGKRGDSAKKFGLRFD